MKTVAIYLRVSTDDQAQEGYSLENQEFSLRAYCSAKGWEIYRVYKDEGYTGRNVRRPGYQKMLEDRDSWDMILVYKMERIHRNSRAFMEMMDNLQHWGKEFSSMNELLDTSTAMGRFVVDIIQRIAQLESEQIGERVYDGMKQKALGSGGFLGRSTPFGYDYIEGNYKVNDKEARIIKLLFELYLAGYSVRKLSRLMNEKKRSERIKKKWSPQGINWILKNPFYCGYDVWDGIVRKDTHPGIIEVNEFNRVQKRMMRKLKRMPDDYEVGLLPRSS